LYGDETKEMQRIARVIVKERLILWNRNIYIVLPKVGGKNLPKSMIVSLPLGEIRKL
jgi:hypothetical protein